MNIMALLLIWLQFDVFFLSYNFLSHHGARHQNSKNIFNLKFYSKILIISHHIIDGR